MPREQPKCACGAAKVHRHLREEAPAAPGHSERWTLAGTLAALAALLLFIFLR